MKDTIHDTRMLNLYPALVAFSAIIDGPDLGLVESIALRDVVVVVILKGAALA